MATNMLSTNHFLKDKKQVWVLRLLFTCWLLTKLLCYDLWMGDRFFPLLPVNDLLLHLSALVHTILFWASATAMVLALWRPVTTLVCVVVIAELLSCILDQNRWQPWEYQFLFMAASVLFFQNKLFINTAWQLLIAALYFFSGLSKLNPAFIHDIWNGLLLRNWLGIQSNNVWIFRAGYLLPLIEMGAGAALLTGRFYKWAMAILILMHIGILYIFGPLGFNQNVVIWPWNILMPLLLVLVFFRQPFAYDRLFFKKRFAFVLVLCWMVLPLLHLAGRWDHYLSFTMYSGGVPQLYICTSDAAALQRMAPFMGNRKNGMIPCRYPIAAYDWGVKAMKTSPYPEKRAFKEIARQWKQWFPGADATFYIYTSGFKPTVEILKLDGD